MLGGVHHFDRHRQRREEYNQLFVNLSVDVDSPDRQRRSGDCPTTSVTSAFTTTNLALIRFDDLGSVGIFGEQDEGC